MNDWSYVRGPHPAILRENTLIAIAGATAEHDARTLLSSVTGDTPLEEVIDVLIADGLARAADFFVGRLEGGVLSAFVRGTAVVTVEDDRWNRSYITGAHARTWQEITIEGVTRMAVGFAPSTRADLLSVRADEREARPGPLGVAEVLFRAPQQTPPLILVTGAPLAQQTLEFDDAFPDDLFAPIDEPGETPVADDQPTDEIEGLGTRFDELFGATRFVGVEAAAVRQDEPGDVVPAPPAATAPALGSVALPDGRRIPIAENMIIGRSPRSERTDGSRLPTLVALDGAPGDVSRNHARVFVEGWNVLVEDLGSANGTVVISPAGTTRRLRSGETALLGQGTVLDLGGVRLLLEDVP